MYSHRVSFLVIGLMFILSNQITLQGQNQVQPFPKTSQKADFPKGDSFKDSKISCQIISGINNTWGYDILVNNKLTIHQPSIPSQPGNEGFKTKESAEKVAKLVIQKMKKGEMPPSIDAKELKKLNAI
jgi:hypothetical protein